ncbi:MAG: GerMN domain-containing protein [Christensenellales bacterium]
MKRLRLTLLLLLLLMMLTACAPSGNSMEALSVTATPQEDEIPRADGDDAAATDTSALIWYRYGDEPMLAAERRTVSRLPNEPYETALLRLLLEGPSLNAPALRGLFPAGTRVISTSRQGKMLFVTLSYQLMNGYSDEPSNWRSDTAWAQEVPPAGGWRCRRLPRR